MAQYFACLCLVAFAATAINAAAVNSGSSNQGLNVMSSGSSVVQNDIQNAQAANALGYAAPYYGLPAGLAPAPGLGYYGYQPYDFIPHPGYGYGYGAQVHSASNNLGANIGSTDSVVAQHNVQNANAI